jgi:hypothetical protein
MVRPVKESVLGKPTSPKLEVVPPAAQRPVVEVPPDLMVELEKAILKDETAVAAVRMFCLGRALDGNYRLVIPGARLEPVDAKSDGA